MKMDFNTGGTFRRVAQCILTDFYFLARGPFWQEDRGPLEGHRSILEKKIIKRSCVELNS